MAAAESVDGQLRAAIRAAHAAGHRCLKARIADSSDQDSSPSHGERPGPRTLELVSTLPEEVGADIAAEFQRCVAQAADDRAAALFLFRTDVKDNDDRWLLIAWLPEGVSEAQRLAHVRSRGLLARLVPQPYFLREFFAKSRADLAWDRARQGGAEANEAALRPLQEAGRLEAVDAQRLGAKPPASAPQGPLRHGQSVALLQKLVKGEDLSLQLALVANAEQGATIGRHAATLECKALGNQTALQLAQSRLPSSACYFALSIAADTTPARKWPEHLLLLLWCPDIQGVKDRTRVAEDARYVAMRPSVARLVLGAFPDPKPLLAMGEARETHELAEAANRARDRMTRFAASSVDLPLLLGAQRFTPAAVAPSPASAAAVPSTMNLDVVRPFPPWRGGSKAHNISSSGTGGSGSSSRSGTATLSFPGGGPGPPRRSISRSKADLDG